MSQAISTSSTSKLTSYRDMLLHIFPTYKMEKHSAWAVHVPKSASATSVGNGTIRKIGKCDRFRKSLCLPGPPNILVAGSFARLTPTPVCPSSNLFSFFLTTILWTLMDSKEIKEKESSSVDDKAPSEDRVEAEAAAKSVHDEEAAIGNGRYRGLGTKDNPYVVEWDIGDIEEPYNWPKSRKWPLTMLVRIGSLLQR